MLSTLGTSTPFALEPLPLLPARSVYEPSAIATSTLPEVPVVPSATTWPFQEPSACCVKPTKVPPFTVTSDLSKPFTASLKVITTSPVGLTVSVDVGTAVSILAVAVSSTLVLPALSFAVADTT